MNNTQALSIPISVGSLNKPSQLVHKAVKLVAFGDSNTTPALPGTISWFRYFERDIRSNYFNYKILYDFTFTNLSENATTVSPITGGGTHQYDIQSKLNLITYADYGIVLLGTNDAWQGVDLTAFQSDYQQLIMTVKTSGKIGKLYVLAVPPMLFPYNCIGSTCWRNTHDPQAERVVPFNNFLSGIGGYCASIGFNCSYINSNNGIQLSTSYLNAGDGVHLLNTSQIAIDHNLYNVISKDTSVMQPSPRPCKINAGVKCL